jgi:hypothetical protein
MRPAKAIAAVITAMCEAAALELDLSIGRSGERNDHVHALGASSLAPRMRRGPRARAQRVRERVPARR